MNRMRLSQALLAGKAEQARHMTSLRRETFRSWRNADERQPG
jgi:hypothetical protein